MKVHLVNPSTMSFGTAVITPRWLYVLAAATPACYGDPNLVRANLVGQIQFYDAENLIKASTGRTGNFYFDPAAFERANYMKILDSYRPVN